MKLSQLERTLNELFPHKYALKNDKVGMQVNCGDIEVSSIHIAYELNNLVIDECIAMNSSVLLIFHPLIYSPLQSININDRVGGLLIRLIKNGISLYCVHTIFDTNPKGTNYLIANKLGLNKVNNLIDLFAEDEIGMGYIGEFQTEVSIDELLQRCNSIFKSPIKFTKGNSDNIKRVAIIGGSGSSFADAIFQNNIDAFITADNSYHTFHRFRDNITLIDPGHYEMEQFVIDGMYDFISDSALLDSIKISKSLINTNPVSYYYDRKF
ncbi:MAG TPA: Nif3-like dinuclear metal center hexameric protein [Candidatus Kapabacteria bacterium]|nr:Nif3-like dinuclear metal center hexameric protein [Candidatus Kapabacteria bacterium]